MEALITQIAAAANMRTLYPAQHPRVHGALQGLIATLRRVVEERSTDAVTFLVVGDDLVVEHEVRRRSSLHQRQLVQLLRRGGVERLTLADGLDLDEADRFVSSIASGTTPESSPHVVLGHVYVGIESESSKDEKRELTADQIDIAREAFVRFRSQRRVNMADMEQLVWSLIDSLSASTRGMLPLAQLKDHDEYTFIHSVNVSLLVLAQARSFGIKGTLLHTIGMAGLLHDIGKLMVPLEILNTPGKLEGEAWAIMQSHAERGAWYLSEMEGSTPLSILVAYEHHLRYDGKPNYPLLRVPRMPNLASRMTAIADAYDAMSTLRPYQKPKLRESALEIIKRNSETIYDPLLVANFVRLAGNPIA